jgi:hypothetical protein
MSDISEAVVLTAVISAAVLIYIGIAGRAYRWVMDKRNSLGDSFDIVAAIFWPIVITGFGLGWAISRPLCFAWRLGSQPRATKPKLPRAKVVKS